MTKVNLGNSNMKKIVLFFVTTVAIIGCVPPVIHKHPEPVTIDNEKFLSESKDYTWSATFNQLFTDAFSVQSADKATGVIVATFKTERAANYIDCGLVKRQYRDEEKKTHKYSFNHAESTEYIYEKDKQVYDAAVKTDLEAEITATVAALGEGSTVKIEVNYTLNRAITSTNKATDAVLPVEEEQIKFTSTEPYKTETFSCITTGAIENGLLNAIK